MNAGTARAAALAACALEFARAYHGRTMRALAEVVPGAPESTP